MYTNSAIPNWDLSKQANYLDVSQNDMNYTIYDKTAYTIQVILKKKITKSGTKLTSQNYLYVYDSNKKLLGERAVNFDDIDSHYKDKMGYGILICPKGKFHPYDFYGSKHLDKPSGFSDNGGWDLRCYDHNTGYFYMFYLLNNGKNFYYKYNGGIVEKSDYVYSYFYDYILENGSYGDTQYKFCVLKYDGANNGVIRLCPESLSANLGNGDVSRVSKGSTNDINRAKSKTQAYFSSDKYFYYFTYNNALDFESGYSKYPISFENDQAFSNSASNPGVQKNTESPLTFADNVEIKEMNFISGTKYAYYKIYSISKDKNYFGLIDITQNKIIYNIEAEFKTFIPASTSDTIIMLGLTETDAYQLCITKSSQGYCINECGSSNKLILDSEGNKCQADCDSGKIKLIPEGICIKKEECDLSIYELNSQETECGLCKYISSSTPYKFINTRKCISITDLPNNAEYYNENSKLLKCKANYHLENNECIPDYCYERCKTCSQVSSDINAQKCLSCNEGYVLDGESGNCNLFPTTLIIPPTTVIVPPTTIIIPPTTVKEPPTTIIIPPTTVKEPPTTIIIPPTTVKEPPTTIIIPPTTVKEPPTTVLIPPTTVKEPPTTLIEPPTTLIEPPTTIIKPPTTVIAPPTTVLEPPTTIIEQSTTRIPKTEYIENCSNKRCLKCSADSDKFGLCISCDGTKYKKVNYSNTYSDYFDCFEEKYLEKNYYYDSRTEQYKPCFEYCSKCSGPGNATDQHCLECKANYMLRPFDNPKNNCVIYTENYYRTIYNEFKPLDSPQCPEEAKYSIKDSNNKTYCIYDCKADAIYKFLYNGNCLKECPNETSEEDYLCKETNPDKIYISINPIYLKNSNSKNNSLDIIGTLAVAYALEYYYTNKHISLFEDENYSILLYKNPGIVGKTNLTATDIDFGECYEAVKKAYNITSDLIIAVGDKKVKNKPSNFYLFFHPETGRRLDIGDLCQNKTIEMKENLLSMLDEKSEKYELQTALTKQGINIFDINDPYYKDLCYDFDNPKKRDMALKDRIKETYVNVTLCDDGCVNTGIDVQNNVATCDCKFNDITNNEIIHENAALNYLVGEIFDIVNSSNILVLKCYKYLLKYFTRSIGGIIIVSLLILCIIFAGIFFSFELTKMKRYIFALTEKYTSFLANYSNIFKLFPPKRKSLKNKTSKEEIRKYSKESNIKDDTKNNYRKNKKQISERTTNPISKSKQSNSKDFILAHKKGNSKLGAIIEKPKEEEVNPYLEDGKKIKKYFKEYLATSPDEMEFDDAIKRDKRKFCEYFCDVLQEKQSFAYTFIASDPINTRMIKFILFSLNIALYFVVNGLFFSESFISELYHTNEEDDTFFSFIPRTIDKVIYTTLVSIFIGYLTDFFFLDEKKIKGIFKRDKNNRLILKRSITMLIREIQKRYISFIIMTLVIMLISLYYILCFNYVYPKTQIEWVKSSILIIIIMQILSVLKCLYEAIFRFLSFKCESEKLYKVAKLFENNS